MRSAYISAYLFVLFSACNGAATNIDNSPIRLIPIPYPGTILLRDPDVVRELGLSGMQAGEAASSLDKVEQDLFRLRDVLFEKRQEKVVGLIGVLNRDLGRIFNVRQRQRYYQLLWQSMKLYAFQEAEMVMRLKLSRQ